MGGEERGREGRGRGFPSLDPPLSLPLLIIIIISKKRKDKKVFTNIININNNNHTHDLKSVLKDKEL